MSKTIYATNSWKGHGKSEYWNEYRDDGDTIGKYKVGRIKVFDGHESEWEKTETKLESWAKGSDLIPDWLNKYL